MGTIDDWVRQRWGIEPDALTGKEVCQRWNIEPKRLWQLVEDAELECKGPSVFELVRMITTTGKATNLFGPPKRKRDLKVIEVLEAYFRKNDIEEYETRHPELRPDMIPELPEGFPKKPEILLRCITAYGLQQALSEKRPQAMAKEIKQEITEILYGNQEKDPKIIERDIRNGEKAYKWLVRNMK